MLIYQRKQTDPQEGRKMGQSGNPAKKAAAKKVAAKKTAIKRTTPRRSTPAGPSSVADFKRRSQGSPLTLPTGLVMVAKRVDLRSYLAQNGEVFNPLLGLVNEALEKGGMVDMKDALGVDEEEGTVDLERLEEMYAIVEGMVCAMCINPRVHPVPEDEYERDDNLLYVDEIDDEDKMFLFQWAVGGTDDVAQFRQEAESDMASLAEITSGPRATKSHARARAR
jgi:hypothetical protein